MTDRVSDLTEVFMIMSSMFHDGNSVGLLPAAAARTDSVDYELGSERYAFLHLHAAIESLSPIARQKPSRNI
jgi:hypothetical protein